MKRKDRHPRLTPDGLPIDAREWTRADWQDLHEAMEKVKRIVGKRHKETVSDRPAALPHRAE